MIWCTLRRRVLWALAAALPVGFFAASGCDDRYSEDLVYPLRTDPVIEAPTEPSVQPNRFDLPGEFPKGLLLGLENLPENSGTKITYVNKKLSGKDRDELAAELRKRFGTPAHPKVSGEGFENEANRQTLQDLRLDDQTLAKGSELYRRHCLQCHGLAGDGRGHTAPWVNPHPRDFRKGMFKFTSTSQEQGPGRKARRDDLVRTIRNGLEGTAMPAFGLLPEDDLQALASYVTHLSLRGQTELYAIFERSEDTPVTEAVGTSLETFVRFWRETEQKAIVPPAYAGDLQERQRLESVTRGYQFFSTNCLSCHENYGRRDVYKYDAWGTIVRPVDLTAANYRGGRRPLDLYWRVHAGINGANMPATVPSAMRPEQVWDVVNFVRALPYPPMLPPEIRSQVYAPEGSGTEVAAK